MSLNIIDLVEHVKSLTAIIEHAQKELDAVKTLIAGLNLRQPVVNDSNIPTMAPSIKKLVSFMHNELKTMWLTSSQATLEFVSRFPKRDGKHVRTNVGMAQKQLVDDGVLMRKNLGDATTPKYTYKWNMENS